jgi:hypothetical protein
MGYMKMKGGEKWIGQEPKQQVARDLPQQAWEVAWGVGGEVMKWANTG